MTNLKTHIATVRNALRIVDFQAITAVNAIEAALFPTGPAPDPTKQFVVGESYTHGGERHKCLFVFPNGEMGSVNSHGAPCLSMPFSTLRWRHSPENKELDDAKFEIAELEAKLAAGRARVKEMEGKP